MEDDGDASTHDPDAGWVDGMAASLVQQVEPFLPPDITISIEGHGESLEIWMTPPSGHRDAAFGFGSIAAQQGWSRTLHVRTAVHSFLNFLQDYVIQETKAQWPASDPLPIPDVAIVHDRVEGWFGDPESSGAYPTVSVKLP